MRPPVASLALLASRVLGPALASIALVGCGSAAGEPPATARRPAAPAPATTDAGPVIVELFTSQGCSSCPPADRVLATLARDGGVGDRAVVPLAFHVDYWDDLGWADPFSRPAWSERQRAYAGRLGGDHVYTPQAIVGGRTDVLGSNGPALRAAIAAAPAPAALAVAIDWSDAGATVTATAPAGADVWVAIYQDDVATRVLRGENAGATLRGEHVVRRFERVATAGQVGRIDVTLDPAWTRLGAVALAQGADRTIVASRALPPGR